MTEPTEKSNFDGAGQRPEQNDEQIRIAAQVEEYLHDVIDPELGINVVDLGLVYDIWVETNDEGRHTAVLNMTLTSPACPLTDVLEDQATSAVITNTECDDLILNWVWMPPWGPQMITEEGREQLRALGFAV
ncbi:metal-sulfur cluster biosynthetic enzyme [Corynebacterium yudongzhengii]|uniref:Metal-sulfur cluster assembly factor n=1 Tax=Corynebacterium yudongzhengii TaxID=2080740 RepID=A0A2U1T8F3_9CORY|nr:metal-sulfur cluster assembly factor [Corynebacterium yudongzhengii]AWB81870.1 metal-sulfur cluster biosynthetic enzyme [Corynebacterium yudongzhengii]PWC02262.1 metal-sulfur cluster assembly factor [Corynebacterium yudongzhengii]